ncbi:MAG: ABC transporter permease [Bacillota bacterium]
MLRKLMKYEIRATARWFIPLYAALLIFTLINRFLLTVGPFDYKISMTAWQIVGILSGIIYVSLFMGIMVVSLVVGIQRFYKSLLGDEGYLMFTLPVKTWKLVMSKLLVTMLWHLLSSIIGICSILLHITHRNVGEFGELLALIQKYVGPVGYVSIPLVVLASVAMGIIQMYTAIALGHLFRKHKILASFGMYVVISTLSQMVFMLVMPFFMDVILSNALRSTVPTPAQINTMILVIFAVFAALTAAGYIATNAILKQRLNLE